MIASCLPGPPGTSLLCKILGLVTSEKSLFQFHVPSLQALRVGTRTRLWVNGSECCLSAGIANIQVVLDTGKALQYF